MFIIQSKEKTIKKQVLEEECRNCHHGKEAHRFMGVNGKWLPCQVGGSAFNPSICGCKQFKSNLLQEVSDFQIDRLLDWIDDKNRKSADIAFTSGRIRNVARKFEDERKKIIEEIDRKIEFWSRPKPDKVIVLPTVVKDLSTESMFNYVRTMIIDVLENLKKELLRKCNQKDL